MHDDIASHIAHRRAQLADLRAMLEDGHTGAAEGIELVLADLKLHGADDQVVAKPKPAAAPATKPVAKPATSGKAKRKR